MHCRPCFNLGIFAVIFVSCLTASYITAAFAEVELPQPVPGYLAETKAVSAESLSISAKVLSNRLLDFPTNPEMMFGLALVEAEQGSLDRALQRARKAERLAPDQSKPHQILSRLYLMNRDGLQARLQAERALELAIKEKASPETKMTVVGLLISALVESKQLEQAEKLSKTWVSKEPKIALSWYLRGWALSLRPATPTEAAIAAYRKALELSPNLAYAHYNLGLLLAKSGENQAASEEFTVFLKNSPEDPKTPTVKELISQLAR